MYQINALVPLNYFLFLIYIALLLRKGPFWLWPVGFPSNNNILYSKICNGGKIWGKNHEGVSVSRENAKLSGILQYTKVQLASVLRIRIQYEKDLIRIRTLLFGSGPCNSDPDLRSRIVDIHEVYSVLRYSTIITILLS
jgi:hypothetical protein